MYVLSLPEGYVQIDKSEDGTIAFVEYKDGISVKLKIKGKSKTVSIIPVGQIVLDSFNKSWEEYKQAGGTRKVAIKRSRVSISQPYCPKWIYPKDKVPDFSIDDINQHFMDNPIEVTYIPFSKEIHPVFSVDRISQLYYYDLLRLKSAGLSIKQCCECGKAFRSSTTGKYCMDCRKAGVREKRKYNNLKNDPALSIFKKITDRNNPRQRAVINSSDYLNNLRDVIDEHKQNDSEQQLRDFATLLSALDKRYYALYKHFGNDQYEYYGDEQLFEKWQKEKNEFPKVPDIITWIEQWEKRIKR